MNRAPRFRHHAARERACPPKTRLPPCRSCTPAGPRTRAPCARAPCGCATRIRCSAGRSCRRAPRGGSRRPLAPGLDDLMARRTGLDAQIPELGALALGVAERLVAPSQVLLRPVLRQMLVPGRGLECEIRIGEIRPPEGHQIRLSRREQRVDLI